MQGRGAGGKGKAGSAKEWFSGWILGLKGGVEEEGAEEREWR